MSAPRSEPVREPGLEAARARLTAAFEAALEAHLATWSGWPARLVESCRYVLQGGGKRVRPLVALLAAEAVGGSSRAAMPWALALEMVHTYSLVHDDLPSMDDDDVRRGRPACHVAFGEALAILTGDALLTEAFRVVGAAPWPGEVAARLTALLGSAAGGAGMVGGQVLDVGAEPLADAAALEAMQRMKTGALFRAAAEGGAVAGGAGDEAVRALRRYGDALGLLFQLTDDLLDRAQDVEQDGTSFLHHLSERDVLVRRDRLVADARAALSGIARGGLLGDLADRVARRTA